MEPTLLHTPPRDIDGEPEDVRELSIQQLASAVAQVADLTTETVAQLKAAGVERCGSLEAWQGTPEAHHAIALAGRLQHVVESLKGLRQAV